MIRTVRIAALALLGAATLVAQAPDFSIVSSVKPSASLDEGIGGTGMQGDVYRITNAPLVGILREAFDLPPVRIIGGPAWVRRDRWDVEVRIDRRDLSARVPETSVIQAMLRDRFQLDAAIERRDMPIYALRLAVADGKLGPMLTRSSFECRRGQRVDAVDIAHQAELRASGVKGAHGEAPCDVRSQRGVISFAGRPLEDLLRYLPADRVVQDQTTLTGSVDLTLQWSVTGDAAVDSAALFAAMRSDLGLKLEPTTAPLDVLVIKSVKRPTPN